jgi:hypothetical protein
MNRLTLFILILSTVVTGACSSRKNKLNRGNIIPEKELTSIITDLYISDGLLTLPRTIQLFSKPDSLSSYKQVIEKHGYTKEAMDVTMKYYFVKNPKQLIKIYDQVLAILSEMESRYEKEVTLMQSRISSMWKGKDLYLFPDPSETDSTDFNMTAVTPGIYTLSFTVTLYPDDQSVNARLTAYTCHPDSIETGKRHYIKTINYLKDGQPHNYSIKMNVQNKSDYHLRGVLYDTDNIKEEWGKHLRIEKISYTYGSGVL